MGECGELLLHQESEASLSVGALGDQTVGVTVLQADASQGFRKVRLPTGKHSSLEIRIVFFPEVR